MIVRCRYCQLLANVDYVILNTRDVGRSRHAVQGTPIFIRVGYACPIYTATVWSMNCTVCDFYACFFQHGAHQHHFEGNNTPLQPLKRPLFDEQCGAVLSLAGDPVLRVSRVSSSWWHVASSLYVQQLDAASNILLHMNDALFVCTAHAPVNASSSQDNLQQQQQAQPAVAVYSISQPSPNGAGQAQQAPYSNAYYQPGEAHNRAPSDANGPVQVVTTGSDTQTVRL